MATRFSKHVGSLNRRRILFWALVIIIITNLLVRLFFVNHFDPKGGMFIWTLQTFIATSAPLIAGMVLDQNLRQKRTKKQDRAL